MPFSTIDIEHKHAAQDVKMFVRPQAADAAGTLIRVARFIMSLARGARRGSVIFRYGTAKATATLTFASTGPTNDQAFSICGTTFTAKTSAAGGGANEFTRSNTPATNATNLAAAINASGTAKITAAVTASASGAVCTFTANDTGTMGNGIDITAGNLSNTTLSAGGFTGGSNGTSTTLARGGAS